ncbi:MAG: HAD family phosphatase [Bacteroidetes bacterium]|nr:MAG: HAD family phosphatase [Bacteroidota bacterium]
MLKLTHAASLGYPVRNIIFDFGGVICNIDIKRSEQKFRELGFRGFNPAYSVEEGQDVFRRLEGGKITIPVFLELLKKHLDPGVTDEEILNAWNEMILDIPAERVRLLEEIRKYYRIFILSNSNEIHYNRYLDDFRKNYGYRSFTDLFEQTWFSFQIHLQKPSKEIFEYVIRAGNLDPAETLFVDDSVQHIGSAGNVGLRTYHLQLPGEITSLFEEPVNGEKDKKA